MRTKRVIVDGKLECISCRIWLPIEAFGVHRAASTGRNWRCKECHKKTAFGGMTPAQRAKQWQRDNPERYASINEASRKRIIHDPKRLQERREQSNRSYHKNQQANLQSHRKWRQNNPWVSAADRNRSLVRMTVNGMLDGGPRFLSLTGLTGTQFQAHLKSLWKPGMGWHNFGRGGWTIGHIKPCSHWKELLLTPQGLQECFHYTNLQPEWEHENNCKHSKESLTTAQISLLRT